MKVITVNTTGGLVGIGQEAKVMVPAAAISPLRDEAGALYEQAGFWQAVASGSVMLDEEQLETLLVFGEERE